MSSPIVLAHDLIGSSEETPRVSIEMVGDAASDFNKATVAVTRDGFQDDSVRGDWHEFIMSRDAGGAWKVVQARRAFRCWRGSVNVYADRKCP